jgi:hypothetical protein
MTAVRRYVAVAATLLLTACSLFQPQSLTEVVAELEVGIPAASATVRQRLNEGLMSSAQADEYLTVLEKASDTLDLGKAALAPCQESPPLPGCRLDDAEFYLNLADQLLTKLEQRMQP